MSCSRKEKLYNHKWLQHIQSILLFCFLSKEAKVYLSCQLLGYWIVSAFPAPPPTHFCAESGELGELNKLNTTTDLSLPKWYMELESHQFESNANHISSRLSTMGNQIHLVFIALPSRFEEAEQILLLFFPNRCIFAWCVRALSYGGVSKFKKKSE